ncbi:hypothetical protein QYE76_027281 [Lolium multiflorum]|uniref:Uncharacterized protein n=1 Tax=Lolium multiflorum TaxID=4521 RepID=A0AAD8VCJ5_LOLMU|nr:hypothetical protein QYE76_027281 [Lolium multiflorum]
MDATTSVVLQFDDGFELTKEVNDLTIVFSLGNDSTIHCLSIFLAVNIVLWISAWTVESYFHIIEVPRGKCQALIKNICFSNLSLWPDCVQDITLQCATALSSVVKCKRKGKGLEKTTQGLGTKVTIEIPEGMKRPEKPLPAAKFASEGGLIARDQMPFLTHFKDYKKDNNMLPKFIGKVGTTCMKNMDNRSTVKFAQKTGSRSYAAHVYATREERMGEEFDAIDLFKVTHHSKKDGFSKEAKAAIVSDLCISQKAPKCVVDVVGRVLTKDCPKSTFLKNVDLSSSKLNKASASAVSAQVVDQEDQLKRSQDQSAEMKAELDAIKKRAEEELAAIKKKADAVEAAQAERDKDYQALLKRTEEIDSRVAQLIGLFGANRSAGN